MNIVLFEKSPETSIIESTDFRYTHIVKVLKLKEGDTFKIGEINSFAALAKIISLDKSGLSFTIDKFLPSGNLHPVTLLMGQVRPICMKRILREAVSLGVETLALVGTDSGEKSYRNAKLYTDGEYKKYMIDGAMQSGSPMMGNLQFYDSVDDALKNIECVEQQVVLDNCEAGVPLASLDLKHKPTVVAIGSERGWSERERSLFRSYSYQFATIGERVLRSETAATAALSITLSMMRVM